MYYIWYVLFVIFLMLQFSNTFRTLSIKLYWIIKESVPLSEFDLYLIPFWQVLSRVIQYIEDFSVSLGYFFLWIIKNSSAQQEGQRKSVRNPPGCNKYGPAGLDSLNQGSSPKFRWKKAYIGTWIKFLGSGIVVMVRYFSTVSGLQEKIAKWAPDTRCGS